MSLRAFWKRNLAFFNLAVASNVEYRFNFLIDAAVQPTLTTLIEILLWTAIFRAAGTDLVNGFGLDYYLAYALWGAFFARIAASWMYEYRMIEEIESGTVNGILVRPMTFYEYYLSQLMGYKFATTFVSFLVPFAASLMLPWPVELARLPWAVLMVFYYLILVHSISFVVSTFAFHFNRVHALSGAKNLCLWFFTGELFPLDLMPEPYRSWIISLPFASGVYLPVGYLTGRIGSDLFFGGFVSVSIALIVVNGAGYVLWKRGLRSYVGTGA